MCFYLTIAVPEEYADQIGEVFGRGFQALPTKNPSVIAALPAGYAARLVTRGMCSCDLYAKPHEVATRDPADHLRRKYEKRGWSEAKIARAIEQASASAPKPPMPGLRVDVVEGLQKLCQSIGSIALLVHWYDSDVETEQLALGRTTSCGCRELLTQARELSEDEVLLAANRRAD